MEDDFVTISKKVYNDLLNDAYFLECLRAYGVDNWEGYDFACNMYNGEEDVSKQKQTDLFSSTETI